MGARPPLWRKVAIIALIVEALIASSVAIVWVLNIPASPPHTPILIVGNSEFTRANGVTHGDGTAESPYTIEHWEIDASEVIGIEIRNTTAHFVIRDVNVRNGPGIAQGGEPFHYRGPGIWMDNVSNGLIEQSLIIDNMLGVYLHECRDITLRANSISETGTLDLREGVLISRCTNITLQSNIFHLNGVRLAGDTREQFDSHSISANNTVNGEPLVYLKDLVDYRLDGASVGQVIAANCSGLNLSNMSVQNADTGFQLAFVSNTTLSHCVSIQCSDYGILVDHSVDSALTRCDVSESINGGVVADHCARFSINNNTLEQNSEDAITLSDSSNCGVSDNVCRDSWEGLWLQSSNDSMISANLVSGSGGASINIGGSNNNTIRSNNVTATQYGLIMSHSCLCNTVTQNTFADDDTGVSLWETVNDTLIYGNNFIRNGVDAADKKNGTNHWSAPYPAGGNFWWNETPIDEHSGPMQNLSGSDGLGDFLIVAGTNVTDPYPLVKPNAGFDTKPLAIFSVTPANIGPGSTIQVNASGSWDFRDPQAKLETRWDWTNDGAWDTLWSTSMTASLQYMIQYHNPGPFWIRLAVRDANGSTSEALELAPVDSLPPVLSLDLIPSSAFPKNFGPEPGMSFAITAYDNGSGVSIGSGFGSVGGANDMAKLELYFDGKDITEAGLSYDMMTTAYNNQVSGYLTIYHLSGHHTIKMVTYDRVGNSASIQIGFFAPLFGWNLSTGAFAALIIVVSAAVGAVVVATVFLWDRRRAALEEARELWERPHGPGP